MTVASEVNRSGPYTGNGVTTVFAYAFRIIDAGHIKVIRAAGGIDTVLVLNTDYTVSGVGDAGGGSITMTVAPTAAQTITIVRKTPFTQETDLVNQGPFFAETIEQALDLSVMRDQQLSELIGNAMRSSATSGFDALGRRIINVADPVSNQDAATKAWVNSSSASVLASAILAQEAAEAAADTIGQAAYGRFKTRAAVTAANIPAGVEFIQVFGWDTKGDMPPCTMARVVSNPGNPGALQSADGAWWDVVHNGHLNLRWWGAGRFVSAADTAALAAAVQTGSGADNTIGATGIHIHLPFGNYYINNGVLIARSSVTISGDGPGVTIITVEPTANINLFTIYNSAESSPGGPVPGASNVTFKDLLIYTTDTTYSKVAFIPINSSHTTLHNVQVLNWTGNNSIGILYKGRELFTMTGRCVIQGQNPIFFDENPHKVVMANIDTDLFTSDGSSFQVLPLSNASNCIFINAAVNVSRMTWKNTWCGGGNNAFSWVAGTKTIDDRSLEIDGFHYEQAIINGGSTILIDRTAASQTLRGLSLSNIDCANEPAVGLTIKGGASTRIDECHILGLVYTGTKVLWSIDDGIRDFSWRAVTVPLDAATVGVGSMLLREGSGWRAGACVPYSGSYGRRPRDTVMWHGDQSSNLRRSGRFEKVITVVDGGTVTLSPFSDFSVQNARIFVQGGVNAFGTAYFTRGATLATATGANATAFDIADTAAKLCVIRTADNNVQVKNRLGVTTDIHIIVEFDAVPNAVFA